jgi:hypothetical protein
MANPNRISGNFGNSPEETSAGGKVQEAASAVTQKAQELGHKAQETASNVASKAKDVAANVADKARDYAATAGEKTDDALCAAGGRMASWGESLRQNPPSGVLGTAATAVAAPLEAGGRYLQEHGLNDMMDDLGSVVRKYPLQSIFIGLGVGCLIGLAFSRR